MKASVPAPCRPVPGLLPALPVQPLADSVPLVLLQPLPVDSVLRAPLQPPLVASVPLVLLPEPPLAASSVVPVAWA